VIVTQVFLGNNNASTFSGDIEPGETVLSPTNRLRIVFESDFYYNRRGFLASYQSGKADV